MSRPPVEIIAEIANAHQGNPDLAVKLAESALKAGADAVKFQVYSADELLVASHPRYQHFDRQSFSPDTWRRILKHFRSRNQSVYCDIFGFQSLQTVIDSGVSQVKVHSSDLGNAPLLEALSHIGGRILLGVGGSTVREIGSALRIVLAAGKTERPVLMHGFQSYPTAVEDSCVIRLKFLREVFGDRCDIGYMDHSDGDDSFAMILPLLALASGARVIEKHITLDRSARGVDYYSSLNPDEFARFVEMTRRAEAAIGDTPELLMSREKEYRCQVKKQWVTTRQLKQGHTLSLADLVMKRTALSLAEPVELEKFLGRSLLRECSKEEPLKRSDVTQVVWALVVARMRSTRLPGKAMINIAGMPALQHLFERLKQARYIDRIVLCTTKEPEDDVLVELAANSGLSCFRGPTDDVLGRMLGALEGHSVDLVLRITGDDILVDPDYADRAVQYHLQVNAEYTDLKALPSGTEVEVFDAELLHAIWNAAKNREGTEYLTDYITSHKDQFRTTKAPVDENHARPWRLTLDTPEDCKVIEAFLLAMRHQGKLLSYRLDDIVEFFGAHQELLLINAKKGQPQAQPSICTDLDWKKLI
jgi:N,N'-diacetyllegionaminate synthase